MSADNASTDQASLINRIRRRKFAGLLFNVIPATWWLIMFFLLPLGIMFYYSLGTHGAFGVVMLDLSHLGLQQYRQFFIPEGASIANTIWYTATWLVSYFVPFVPNLSDGMPTPYVQLLFRSVYLAVLTTVSSLLLGYPIAYFIARKVPTQYQNILVALIVLPYWASFLVRIYAVRVMLADNGLVNGLLSSIGIGSNFSLLYSNFAVGFGLTYVYIPFMILPLYASLEQSDPTLVEAAMDLGADRLKAFRKITLPLSMPGIVAGSILVFIPSVGTYVIPELLGGTDTSSVGQFIATQFGSAGNWPLGSAASFILLIIMFSALWVYQNRAEGDLL